MKQRAYNRVAEQKETVASDSYRLHYHLMPPVGLLNDPNGFVFYKGKYHMFYQWNPFETKHGAKFWGHYISDDLVHWEEAPIALAPDQWYDKNGCYSGSAVVLEDKMYVFYTGNVKDEEGNRESYQCLAISDDGIHFEKKGPVIRVPEGYTAHFRDPKVFYKNDQWYMVLGAQTTAEEGEVVLYSSADLMNWRFLGSLVGSGHNGLGYFGYMWECPDLFELNDQDILIVCPQGLAPKGYEFQNIFQSGYFAGKVDYEQVSFDHGTFVELDRGFDFYAPQTTEDARGRRILFGWMGNAEDGDITHPTVKHEWIHALTLPRELKWENGKLVQQPVEELKSLRREEVRHDDVVIEGNLLELPEVAGQIVELELLVKDWNASEFTIQMGESTKIIYDQEASLFTLGRAGIAGDKVVEYRRCVVRNLEHIRIFKDASSIEIFVNNGEEVFSSRVFDNPEADSITFYVNGGNVKTDIKKWNLDRVFAY
nr:sucrose-6-phosphate hydrolase [Oceanobacillus senegalensis]